MRKSRNAPLGPLTPGTKEITFTVRADESILARITSLLLLAEIPHRLDEVTEKAAAQPMPWETPEEAEASFEALPPTREEYTDKATKLIQAICDTYLPGMDNVKLLLDSFGVPRFSALSDDKLPVFVNALESMPMDPARLPAFIEVLHASESLI